MSLVKVITNSTGVSITAKLENREVCWKVKPKNWRDIWSQYCAVNSKKLLRKGYEAIEREALDWNPQGKRRRGTPKHMWRKTVHNEALEKGMSWSQAKRMAGNRTGWRCFVDALCPPK